MNFSQLCSQVQRHTRALDVLYDDPMTQHYGIGGEMAPLVERNARAGVLRDLQRNGFSVRSFLDEIERRCTPHEAARWASALASLRIDEEQA